MRKSFNTYLIIWAIALVLFNLVIFVIPSSIDGWTVMEIVTVISTTLASNAITNGTLNVEVLKEYLLKTQKFITDNIDEIEKCAVTVKEMLDKPWFYKYGGAFWPCYVIIMFVFIGQLVCAYFAFKETNNQKFFYKIPLITISYTGLVFTLIFGIVGMFFSDFPIWLAVAICVIIFAITLVALLKANLAATIISNKDDKIAESTAFMKEMTAKAKALYEDNKDNDDLRKLYETFRYANPILKDMQDGYESNIRDLFANISKDKKQEDIEKLIDIIKIKK